jgi:hypothetical protein
MVGCSGQCLDRRIGEGEVLTADIEAWQRQRNAFGAHQMEFTTEKGRNKLAPALPPYRQRDVITVQRY